jgi:hypothetical protein
MMDEKAKIPHSTGNKDYGYFYWFWSKRHGSFFLFIVLLSSIFGRFASAFCRLF